METEIVQGARALYGERLLGLFLFGSRIAGTPRSGSDLDVGVWLAPPITRRTSWLPWANRFGDLDPTLDPTFFTSHSLDEPSGWLLEAVRQGVQVVFDPTGTLRDRLDAIRRDLAGEVYRRRLYMGLPYYERAVR